MVDDPLTIRPDLGSKLIGRAQGMYASASQNDFGLMMVLNLEFLEGKFNGSTMSLLGRNKIFAAVREMPIVGGSGLFRFARGYALAKTYSFNVTAQNAIVEYNVYFTHLHFYFHDLAKGPKSTAVIVAQANTTDKSRTLFGQVRIGDEPLTIGPDWGSKPIGKAQGMYAYASQNDFGLMMVMNFEFLEGKYNGSTMSLLGRNDVFAPVREMPIVGGTGLFRFARGYARVKPYSFDVPAQNATVEYDIYVSHY
ncbi:hypothetical protein PIB30_053032 [Stylosanthes scabra]|uniref:Dirigent protein n=1 Tax=Stylosanthes scabra TaxID=79078 RepID=A0ABU6RIR9_9FABA|nr:hypothetical protein [Stylosanthes scabra]